MGWQWNGKQDVVVVLVLLSLPLIVGIIAMMTATLIPFACNHPALFWVLTITIFIAGFIVVCKRAGKK